jgi:glycosyltransferase involved in cell wall biosynthesis
MGRIHYWVDCACELDENNGIQRVCRYLARGLEEQGQRLVYRRWSDSRSRPTFFTRRRLQPLARWQGPRLIDAPRGPSWWLDLTQAPRPGDWLLVPDTTYGRATRSGGHETRAHDLSAALIDHVHARGMKIAFIVHDLLPIELPDDPLRELHIERTVAIARADLVLPVSDHAADAVTRYFRDTPLPSRPVEILCVSTIAPRKNQLTLLQAFEAFCLERPDVDVRLTLAGRSYSPSSDQIVHIARANPRVALAGFLSDADVIAAYDRAHFSVFPSIAEGYGLPIVESLWLGKPCLCANFGSMAEIAAGGGCFTVDTWSTAALKNGLERLILNPALRQELTASVIHRPMRTWRNYAGHLLAVLRQHDEG